MDPPRIDVSPSYPLDLHYVKALFLEKQYRQCIATCRNILNPAADSTDAHPVRDTFVRFYLALAHDELARGMHNFSHAKLPAFNQAEQFYDEALLALPSASECLAFTVKQRPETERPASEKAEAISRHDSLHSYSASEHIRPRSEMRSPAKSTPTHTRNYSLPVRSPSMSVSAATTSDFDDLESHESYNEIMTPSRMPKLERDYSSMSLLLQPAPRQVSHGLMRPVRLGSPAKPYQLPSRANTNPAHQPSSLPRLNTTPRLSSPVRKQLRTTSEQASPIESPVSPLDSEDESFLSDAETLSPVSPDTPYPPWGDPKQQPHFQLVNDHLRAMQVQLQSHLRLLQNAKQKTADIQAERSVAHSLNNKKSKTTSSNNLATIEQKRLPTGRSYWSFTPEDVRIVEKQNRIQAGRARDWRRERFDPQRYQHLADAALAEL
jgi:hypothetical protein